MFRIMDGKRGGHGREQGGRKYVLRPQAHPLCWNALKDTERGALRDLIGLLIRATELVRANEASACRNRLVTSLLVGGPRGSGKTTVLLSAAEVVSNPERFFDQSGQDGAAPEREEGTLPEEVRRANLGRRIIWLDPLDLAFVGPSANLLATLLVRIREVLRVEQGPSPSAVRAERGGVPPSLLETSVEDTWARLDDLILDATWMWESPDSSDSHVRAEDKIHQAEIYASFSKQFGDAIAEVARQYATFRWGLRDKPLIVLPIDNVDRSARDVQQILKLMNLAYSPQLWYLIAASPGDMRTFLHRAHRESLQGREGGADPALDAIARQQAAAYEHTVLPAGQQVKVRELKPHEALEFVHDSAGDRRSLQELLGDTALLTTNTGEESRPVRFRRMPRHLLDLFVLDGILSEKVLDLLCEADEREQRVPGQGPSRAPRPPRSSRCPRFSHAGRAALALPLRTLQDLWISALHEIAKDGAGEPSERAIRLAARMFKTTLAESNLPCWASDHLLNEVMTRDDQRRIMMDLRQRSIRRESRCSQYVHWRFDAPRTTSLPRVLYSEIELRDFNRFVLFVEQGKEDCELAPPASGWFMLLHDLLREHPRPGVLADLPMEDFPPKQPLTRITHFVQFAPDEIGEVALVWPRPELDLFYDYARVALEWRAFLELLRQHAHVTEGGLLLESALSAWIDTIASLVGGGEEAEKGGSAQPDFPDFRGLWTDGEAGPCEHALARLAKAKQRLGEDNANPDQGLAWRPWFQSAIHMIAMPEYVPVPSVSTKVQGLLERAIGAPPSKAAIAHARYKAVRRAFALEGLPARDAERRTLAFFEALGHSFGPGAGLDDLVDVQEAEPEDRRTLQ